MNGDEIKIPLTAARGNSKSSLNVLHVLLVYKALFGEEKLNELLEAINKDMKKDGLYLKDYIKLEEPK